MHNLVVWCRVFIFAWKRRIIMIKDILEISGIAGEIIREGFGKNFQIEFKTNEKNLVTEIDKKSEKVSFQTGKNLTSKLWEGFKL